MASWQMCRHRANTFVLVFGIMNTTLLVCCGCGLGGVSPPFNQNPQLRTTQVLSSVYHAHEYLFVHLVHNSSSVALQLHSSASQPAGGSAIHVDNTRKVVEWQVQLMQHLASSGDLSSVPSGGCML